MIGEGSKLAQKRKSPLSVVILGDDLKGPIEELSRYPIDRIYAVEAPELKNYLCGPYSKIIAALAKQEKPEIILCGATANGRSFFPRVAGLLHTGLTADATELDIDPQKGHFHATRPAFGGNIMATIVCPKHRPQLATVRPKVLTPPPRGEVKDVETVHFNAPADLLSSRVSVLETIIETVGSVSIADSQIIVAGGLGVGSQEGFKVLESLAEEIGGAIGST